MRTAGTPVKTAYNGREHVRTAGKPVKSGREHVTMAGKPVKTAVGNM